MNKSSPKRAVEYLRRSTTHQDVSIDFQQSCIRKYAEKNGIVVVDTYIDDGKSGLTLDHRPALKSLLSLVFRSNAEFEIILIYDVSRWGRFQDIDEGAHYEFLCRQAGKELIYCAENLGSDKYPFYGFLKNIKRLMAAEFSRSLSQRVSSGQSRLTSLGFHVGSSCPYGLRRMLVDSRGKPRTLMQLGERKAMANDRIVLVPGPAEEIQVVQSIFTWFVNEHLPYYKIKKMLEERHISPPSHCLTWSRPTLRSILKDERYIGTMTYKKTSRRLTDAQTKNCVSDWVRKEGCISPIIELELFLKAQKLILNCNQWEDKEIVAKLKEILAIHGKINLALLAQTPAAPSRKKIIKKFGSLENAYNAAGYFPKQQGGLESRIQIRKNLFCLTEQLKKNGLTSRGIYGQTLLVENKLSIRMVQPVVTTSFPQGRIEFRKHAEFTVVILDPTHFPPDEIFFVKTSSLSRRYWYCPRNLDLRPPPEDWRCCWEDLPQKILAILSDMPEEKYPTVQPSNDGSDIFSLLDSMIRKKLETENHRSTQPRTP